MRRISWCGSKRLDLQVTAGREHHMREVSGISEKEGGERENKYVKKTAHKLDRHIRTDLHIFVNQNQSADLPDSKEQQSLIEI